METKLDSSSCCLVMNNETILNEIVIGKYRVDGMIISWKMLVFSVVFVDSIR